MWCKIILAAALSAAASPALAEAITTRTCDWLADVRNIVEPWQENTRTFYQRQVRVIFADSIEPACCWAHLLVLLPDPENELGERSCVAVNLGGIGFSGLKFDALAASYDPAVGLTLKFPYAPYNSETAATGAYRQARF